MLNPNLENLRAMHGEKAMDRFREIADLGGFGTVGNNPGDIDPNYRGGLDVAGVLSDKNTAVSERAKERIAEICGEQRKEEFASKSSKK